MVQSGLHILRTDMGLDVNGIEVGRMSLPVAAYPDPASRVDLLDRVTAAAEGVPGLTGVAFTNSWPLQQAQTRDLARDEPGEPRGTRAGVVGVTGPYFDLLDVDLLDGRGFAAADRVGTPLVAIASRTLAARFWPDRRAVGRRIRLLPAAGAPPGTAPTAFEIAGVVEDVRHSHIDDDLADLYVALSQFGTPAPFVYLRATGSPGAFEEFRAALARVDAGVVTTSARPLVEILDRQRAGPRFLAELLVVFAALSTLLALLGIHGVITYAAGQRRREIAVRMAIGAGRPAIVALFVRQGAVMVAAGVAAGTLGAVALGGLLQSQLFGVSAVDLRVLAGAAVVFGLSGLVAATAPARKAASVDPADALKDA
jgi:hypothetical protein